jgi:hypothetical protein
VPGYAELASQINEDSLAFLTMGAATVPFTTPQGAAVLLPSEAGIKQIVDAFLSDSQLTQEKAFVQIQNGTNQEDLAKDAVDYISSLGIPLAQLEAVEDGPTVSQTEIIVYTGKEYTARRIASWLEIPEARIRVATDADWTMNPTGWDIIITLANDAKLEVATR